MQAVSNNLKEAAKIYRKEPLSTYHIRVNEEAAKLADEDVSLLSKRGELLERARKNILESGTFMFKKGRSRSKSVLSSDSFESSPSLPCPRKKSKLDAETRKSRIQDLEDAIQDIDESISFKERRRAQAETVRDYHQCDEITERMAPLREKRRFHKQELTLLRKKESQALWYMKRKSREKSCSSDVSDVSCVSHASTSIVSECSKSPECEDSAEHALPLSDNNEDSESPLFVGLLSPSQ